MSRVSNEDGAPLTEGRLPDFESEPQMALRLGEFERAAIDTGNHPRRKPVVAKLHPVNAVYRVEDALLLTYELLP